MLFLGLTAWEGVPTYARSMDTSSMSNAGGLGPSSTPSCLGQTSCTPGSGMSCTPGLGQSCNLGLMGSCDSVSGETSFDYLSTQHGTDGLPAFSTCSNNVRPIVIQINQRIPNFFSVTRL